MGAANHTLENNLEINLLGALEVVRDGRRVSLPPSKKTRALLAYLVATPRAHRRERLCSLLWDAVDPRSALRWSLSRIRPLVNQPGVERIVADRESVQFVPAGAAVDVLDIARATRGGLDAVDTATLQALGDRFRGEFLEGLELLDFEMFEAWCVAERERVRTLHAAIRRELVARLHDQPAEAIPHALELTRIDPLDEAARVDLMRLLAAAGRVTEAEQAYRAGSRTFERLGVTSTGLHFAWRELSAELAGAPAIGEPERASPQRAMIERESEPAASPMPPSQAGTPPLIGRDAELARLCALVDEVAGSRVERVVLMAGDQGVGKSRLLRELIARVAARNGLVLEGASYEAENGRPYGPWIDALRRTPAFSAEHALAHALAPLLPELPPSADDSRRTKDQMYSAVIELLAECARAAAPVLVAFDDIQWCDGASAELLHYAARMSREQPILVVLAMRTGELADNPTMLRVVRGLRREGLLERMDIEALGQDSTRALVEAIAPQADAERIVAESAGNPLYAIELARTSWRPRDELPPTVSELVRERVDRLPAQARELVHWFAVLGQRAEVARIRELASLDDDELAGALEGLESSGILRASGSGYEFAHDLVRRALYGQLSGPRRTLMHGRIARMLAASGHLDPEIAADVAHHAIRAGDSATAARACVTAGDRCLRLFANTDAWNLARRGLHHAASLDDRERVALELELTRILHTARRPDDTRAAAADLQALAEQALDLGATEHACLGFQLVSWLRWESGAFDGAWRMSIRAEEISRSGNDAERVVAVAEAARCLVLVERDLPQAESLLLESRALGQRIGVEPEALPVALGILRLYQGAFDEAADLLDRGRTLARSRGDRLGEFRALEHRVMTELARPDHAAAEPLALALASLGERLREGSEGPFAAALVALCRHARDQDGALAALDAAIERLRTVDAKQRLGYVLTRAAQLDIARGQWTRARTFAREALQLAEVLGRPSEFYLAHATLTIACIGDDSTRSWPHLDHPPEPTSPHTLSYECRRARAEAERLVKRARIAALP